MSRFSNIEIIARILAVRGTGARPDQRLLGNADVVGDEEGEASGVDVVEEPGGTAAGARASPLSGEKALSTSAEEPVITAGFDQSLKASCGRGLRLESAGWAELALR